MSKSGRISSKDLDALEKLKAEYKGKGVEAFFNKFAEISVELELQRTKLERFALNLKALNIDVVNEALFNELYAERLELDATDVNSLSSGLLDLEYTGDGIPFRWTGGKEEFCNFVFHIDRAVERDLAVEFLNSGPLTSNTPPKIVTYIDQKQVSLDIEGGTTFITYRTVLPSLKSNALTKLDLMIPTWRPTDVDSSSTDERILGLAFTSLKIS